MTSCDDGVVEVRYLNTLRPAACWFHIGGTSLSAPFWAAVFTDKDAFAGHRVGNANYILYASFDNPFTRAVDFHDITGFHQVSNNNGFCPVTPGFDEATGIGTPNLAGVITGRE